MTPDEFTFTIKLIILTIGVSIFTLLLSVLEVLSIL